MTTARRKARQREPGVTMPLMTGQRPRACTCSPVSGLAHRHVAADRPTVLDFGACPEPGCGCRRYRQVADERSTGSSSRDDSPREFDGTLALMAGQRPRDCRCTPASGPAHRHVPPDQPLVLVFGECPEPNCECNGYVPMAEEVES